MILDRRRCLICYGDLGDRDPGEHHARCLRKLFGSGKLPKLQVDPDQLHLLGLEMVGTTTLSGVQRKLALGLEHGTLRVSTLPTRYILKPREDRFPHIPENEHLCLRLARKAGFDVLEHGLVRLEDQSLALIVKRFDRTDDGHKLALEDFCQLAGLIPAEKYEGSAELCAGLVRQYATAPLLDLRELFRLFLFSWWIGNGDLHLKNLSLLTRRAGEPRLSPIYDLVNTELVIPGDTLALPIGGKKSNLKTETWLELGERCSLPVEVVGEVALKMALSAREALYEIERCFLPEQQKLSFSRSLLHRFTALVDLARAAALASKRPSVRVPGPRVLTGKRVAQVWHGLRGRLREAEIKLEKTALGGDLSDLEWLATSPAGVFDDDGAFRKDVERGRLALFKTARYERIWRAIRRCEGMSGLDRVLRHFKKLTISESEAVASQAWDLLFQLEVAAQLRAPWWSIELESKADVLIKDPSDNDLAIECKRPRKPETIESNISKAVSQIEKSGYGGVVAISLDLVLPPYAIAGKNESLEELLAQEMESRIAGVRGELGRLLPTRDLQDDSNAGVVLGVLFGANLITFQEVQGGASMATQSRTVFMENPALSWAAGMLEFLTNVMTAGERELQLRD